MPLQVSFREVCDQAHAQTESGKLPRIRIISWEDYSRQLQENKGICFPPPLTEARQMAYWDHIVVVFRVDDKGDYLVVLSDMEVGSA